MLGEAVCLPSYASLFVALHMNEKAAWWPVRDPVDYDVAGPTAKKAASTAPSSSSCVKDNKAKLKRRRTGGV